MADSPRRADVERWVSLVGSVVAPATLISALLFYFGYVSSRSQFAYFGVDVDTIGLSTRDYIMRSPQPLLVPLLLLTGVAVSAVALHVAIRSRIAASDPAGRERIAGVSRLAQRTGLGLLGAGAVLVLTYELIRDWPYYALVTPLVIAIGAAVLAYASRIRGLVDTPPAEGTAALRRVVTVLVWVLVAASLFWATATIAQWSGRGLAKYSAKHLDRLPSVILDTKERLYLRDPGIEETALPASAGQTFHFRYRHLRLLIQGKDRIFLVPSQWSASDSTLVVPFDSSVRLQFQFENDLP